MLLEHVCHTMVYWFTLCTQSKVLRADSARDALSIDMRLPFNGLLFFFSYDRQWVHGDEALTLGHPTLQGHSRLCFILVALMFLPSDQTFATLRYFPLSSFHFTSSTYLAELYVQKSSFCCHCTLVHMPTEIINLVLAFLTEIYTTFIHCCSWIFLYVQVNHKFA